MARIHIMDGRDRNPALERIALVESDYFNSKIIITGGLGFIGSNLARRLVALGADVTLVDSLIPAYGGNRFNIHDIEKEVHVNISDVRDAASLEQLVQGKDYLFNLAGQTSHLDSMEDPFTDLEINCQAQLSILEVCRKVNPSIKIVFASTRQLYGRPDYLPVDEKHLLRPVDVNGINKMAGEWYHILYNNVYDIRSSSLRLTNTIGPGMRIKDARQTFVGIWIRRLLEGRDFEVWGGEQLRDFNHVGDVVDAFLLAATNEKAHGEIFNLGSAPPVSLRHVAELLIKIHGSGHYEIKKYPDDRKRIDIGDYYGNYGHIKETLGWEPRTTLADSLSCTLDYYRRNMEHYL
ncbi:MAG: NAD-dependent epimerase/dehydratase family protein [Methylacidiphilales bacterium]|nr:NAD-dependent epimerase/dehydratase family protein [Candidatus Methylacidiphilales bacterium]